MYEEDDDVEKEDFKMGEDEDIDNPEEINDLLDLDEEDPDKDH
jgi:hypothetical protein